MFKKMTNGAIFLLLALYLTHCANLSQMLNQMSVRKPVVQISDAKLNGLNFEQVDLLFGIDVSNPNSIGINMDGFDYELLLNDNSFLSGNQPDKLSIEANETSRVNFPVSLRFTEIYNTLRTLVDKDSTKYQVKLGLLFNLPVLGATRIPVSHTGIFPIPKIPVVEIKELKLNRISITGADLVLKIAVDNPNSFAMMFNKLNYNFEINGINWASGKSTNTTTVNAKQSGVVSIPLSLDFMQMGRSVYQLLNGNQNLNYKLTGNMDVSSSISLLGEHSIPFDKSGDIRLMK